MSRKLPVVYACSGCSSAAQLANQLALWLDREGVAEMSCIAGVGGGVPGLVRLAQSGRRILALDGCVLACVQHCLACAGVKPDQHVVLSDLGVKKLKHADFNPRQAQAIHQVLVRPAAIALANERTSASLAESEHAG